MLRDSAKRPTIISGLLLLLALVFLAALWAFGSIPAISFPECPFYRTTKLYCPGCGSTRALNLSLQGNFSQAVSFNPLLFAAVAYIVLLAIARLNRRCSVVAAVITPALPWVVCFYFILRNVPVHPFALLAPG
jgi:hypothetical protein